MQRRLRKLFIRVKERSSVSLAKVATAGGFCDVDLIIVKATAPDDFPLAEKYVNELLKIFSISPSSFRTFSMSFTRRFGKTHCWRVALKCLLLLHRLLRSLPLNSPFRSELLWMRSNSLLSLHPCHFRDESSSTPEDFTLFVRSYAHLLDEAIDCIALDIKAAYDEEEIPESFSDKMKEVNRLIEVLPQLQSVIDRVMDCRPIGVASRNFIVKIAMKHIIRDSFICYTAFRREIVLVLDNLFQMPYRSCTLAFGIYKKAAMQANQLCEFYDWCKALGFCGAYEYPFIDRIPHIQIQALETFLNGMWQLTESPSSPGSSGSPSTLTASSMEEDGDCREIVKKDFVISNQWEKFEENGFLINLDGEEEREPLIQFVDGENDNWEDLLDASVDLPRLYAPESIFSVDNGYEYVGNKRGRIEGEPNKWQMQVYDSQTVINPFYQPYYLQHYHETRGM